MVEPPQGSRRFIYLAWGTPGGLPTDYTSARMPR
jgi:hypothetical protein